MDTLSNTMKSFRTAAVMGAALATAMPSATVLAEPVSTTATLTSGQCMSMADMNTAMRAAGQRTLIIGDRAALIDEGGPSEHVRRWVNTVTSNADGSVGYQIEGNNPRATQSTEVCVRVRLTNVRLLDARLDAVPNEVLLGGRFNDAMRSAIADGTRPMVVADTVLGAGATERRGLPIVVLGRLESETRPGMIAARRPTGESEMLIQMQNLEYTSVALERLDATRLAAVQPPRSTTGGSVTLAAFAPN